MQIGAELGRGLRSVVYAYGDDEVVKIPNEGTPESWIVEELRIADSVAAAGAPVPGGRRIETIGGRIGLVSELIEGPSMGEALHATPDRVEAFGGALAEIQLEVWACTPSYELPLQRDRIEAKIYAAARRFGDDLLGVIELIPDDRAPLVLCHGDLHPRNVLHGATGSWLVDWFDAARGVAAAAVARTELTLTDVAAPVPGLTAGDQRLLDRLAAAYRAAIDATGRCDPAEIDRWRGVQRVARLAEGFGTDSLDELRRWLDGR